MVTVRHVSGALAAFAMVATTGCFATNRNGFELTASLGAHAVHDYKQEQRTYATPPCAGLKAWWYGCDAVEVAQNNKEEGLK